MQNGRNNVSFRQRASIESLVNEEISAIDIHQRLQRVYGDVCMGASSVRRWVKHFDMDMSYTRVLHIKVAHCASHK
jgi:hypothetical protein